MSEDRPIYQADKILGNGRPDPNNPSLSDTIPEEDWKADVYQEAIRNTKPRPLIDDLMDYCAKWQKRLRLMDWKVVIRVSRARDMFHKEAQAEIYINRKFQSAQIDFQDLVDFPSDATYPFNPEKLILHELLHIVLDAMGEPDVTASDAEELAIEKLCCCLMEMEWQTTPIPTGEYREVKLD